MLDNELSRTDFIRQRASKLILGDTVIIDTETTGIRDDSEIVEIAILAVDGSVLLHELIKPLNPIDPHAIAVHGITDEMVQNCPTFSDLSNKIYSILKNKTVVAHNVEFDIKRLAFEFKRSGYTDYGATATECTMLLSMMNPKERWKRLSKTMKWLGIEYAGDAHRAVYDAECCRLILHGLSRLGQ